MKNFPQRKQNRIKYYDYSQNGYYYVTICTYKRQKLFKSSCINSDMSVDLSDTLQNQIIEKWLFESENKYNIIIDKYVIMPDHIHFILIIANNDNKDFSLPDIIQWFKSMTTNEYIALVKDNKINPFNKKIWQKSYYEHIIRNDDDYMACVEYIINNPIKQMYHDIQIIVFIYSH